MTTATTDVHRDLLGLGRIFEILGRNSHLIMDHPEQAKLIIDYVSLFTAVAPNKTESDRDEDLDAK